MFMFVEFRFPQRGNSINKKFLAETEGFEPPVSFPTLVFKTSAIARSATSPMVHLREHQ